MVGERVFFAGDFLVCGGYLLSLCGGRGGGGSKSLQSG